LIAKLHSHKKSASHLEKLIIIVTSNTFLSPVNEKLLRKKFDYKNILKWLETFAAISDFGCLKDNL
jgi:hypothetical protein